MTLRGAELVVEALEAEKVRQVMGIPGTHNIELYDALERSPTVEPVLVTHEAGAAFMADGMARTTGQVGVINVVPGAGITHCLSGVAEAFMDGVPLVVLACGIRTDTGTAYQLHAIDQMAVLAPVVKEAHRVRRAEDIVPTIRRAFAVARAGTPGPVGVEIPAELMMLAQDGEVVNSEFDAPPEPPLDRTLVEQAADLLTASRRPALYVGAGAAGAAEQVVALAERLGAPVCTTIAGKGVMPEDHPLWLWNGFGAQAPPFVRRIMEERDLLLAVGCRFSEVATGSYGIGQPERLIHVDINPEVFNRNYPAELVVQADAGDLLRGVLELISGARDAEGLMCEIAEGHRQVGERWASKPSRDRVTPHRLFTALQANLRQDAVYATDSGNGTFLAAEHLRLAGPNRLIAPVDFSCMGYSVPAAVGAALASPGRDVCALPGDGAFLMTGLELLTATAYRAAPLVCVLRDGKLGQIAQFQKIPLNRETCSELPDYSVEGMAAAVGARYFRLCRDEELDTVLPAAIEIARAGVPAVVETAIDYGRKTYFTKGVVKTNFWRLPWRDRMRMLGRALARRL
jgi:acetolactate synthase-1/2/3 large subunit